MFVDIVDVVDVVDVVVDVVEDMEETTTRGSWQRNNVFIYKRSSFSHAIHGTKLWLRSSSGIFNCMSDWSK